MRTNNEYVFDPLEEDDEEEKVRRYEKDFPASIREGLSITFFPVEWKNAIAGYGMHASGKE